MYSEISKLRKEKAELETFCKDLECQLQALEKDNAEKQEELDKELSMKKQKQTKLDELLCTLESEHERLSLTQREVRMYTIINVLFFKRMCTYNIMGMHA